MAVGGKYDWGRGEDHCAEHTLLMGAGGDIGTESDFFFKVFNSILLSLQYLTGKDHCAERTLLMGARLGLQINYHIGRERNSNF